MLWSRIEKTMETRGFSRETMEILERLLLWCNEAAQLQKPERFQVPEAPLGPAVTGPTDQPG